MGWNNSNVTVTFTCSDASSGIASCSGPVTVANEGANQSVTGHAVDNAGNTNSIRAFRHQRILFETIPPSTRPVVR